MMMSTSSDLWVNLIGITSMVLGFILLSTAAVASTFGIERLPMQILSLQRTIGLGRATRDPGWRAVAVALAIFILGCQVILVFRGLFQVELSDLERALVVIQLVISIAWIAALGTGFQRRRL